MSIHKINYLPFFVIQVKNNIAQVCIIKILIYVIFTGTQADKYEKL